MHKSCLESNTHEGASFSLSRIASLLKLFFFLLPIFKLTIFESYPMIDKLYSLWAAFSLFVLIVISLQYGKWNKRELIDTLFMAGFCLIYSVMTYFYTPVAFLGSVAQSVRIMIFPFYILAHRKLDFGYMLNNICVFFKFLLLIDSVSVFIDYDGLLQYSLLGLDNTVIFLMIPQLTIIMFNDYYRFRTLSKSSIFVLLACIAGKVYSGAVTACFSIFVFIVAYYIAINENSEKKMVRYLKKAVNPTIVFGFFVFFTLMTILFDLTPFFSAIFSIVGKNGTLSGRTNIWAHSVKSILKNPILGYGQAYPVYFQKIVGLSKWATSATHTHNFALELLWSSGIIGTFLFMCLFIKAITRLYKYKQLQSIRILGCGFTAFCILMITDSYIMQPSIVMLIFLCLNIEKIMIQRITKGI